MIDLLSRYHRISPIKPKEMVAQEGGGIHFKIFFTKLNNQFENSFSDELREAKAGKSNYFFKKLR